LLKIQSWYLYFHRVYFKRAEKTKLTQFEAFLFPTSPCPSDPHALDITRCINPLGGIFPWNWNHFFMSNFNLFFNTCGIMLNFACTTAAKSPPYSCTSAQVLAFRTSWLANWDFQLLLPNVATIFFGLFQKSARGPTWIGGAIFHTSDLYLPVSVPNGHETL